MGFGCQIGLVLHFCHQSVMPSPLSFNTLSGHRLYIYLMALLDRSLFIITLSTPYTFLMMLSCSR